MTKNLDSCVSGYKCRAHPKLAWMRDHPKAVELKYHACPKTFMDKLVKDE